MTDMHDYLVFGLRVRSEFGLPELFPVTESGIPDVIIRRGSIAEPIDTIGIHPVADGMLFVAPGVGRYRISGGNEILVEPVETEPGRNVRLYLLGSAFGALLHQRGLLPLHANAIEVDGQAVAFMGPSGAGKSTLAMWFHDCGFKVIADDICVIGLAEKGPATAAPGLPRFRLWQEALEASGRRSDDYSRAYVGDAGWNKFDVPIGPESAARQNAPVRALYVLGTGDEFSIRRLEGVEAAEAVFANTYRGAFVAVANGAESHWSAVVRLVQQVPVFQLLRPLDLRHLDSGCERILDHVRTIMPACAQLAS